MGLTVAVALTVIEPSHVKAQDATSLELLQSVAKSVNKLTPMMVDNETELSQVGAEPGALVYHNRLIRATAAAIAVDQLKAFAHPTVAKRACTNPNTRKELLNRGIVMRYIYRDKDGLFLLSFDVTAADCGQH